MEESLPTVKFGLGTASWNRLNNRKELDRHLEFSRDLGFSFIDTSSFYSGGRNQWLLSKSRFKNHFDIIVKVGIPYTPYLKFERRFLPTLETLDQNLYLKPTSIKADVVRSLKRLGLKQVSTVLLHSYPSESVSLISNEYKSILLRMKEIGLCENIGISSDSIAARIPEWVSMFESSIDLLPRKHYQARINHVFFGVSRSSRGKRLEVNSWPCIKSCEFTFLAGTTDPHKLVEFTRFVKQHFNLD